MRAPQLPTKAMEALFWYLPIQWYGPVQQQVRWMVEATNHARRRAGLPSLRVTRCVRRTLRRPHGVKTFGRAGRGRVTGTREKDTGMCNAIPGVRSRRPTDLQNRLELPAVRH